MNKTIKTFGLVAAIAAASSLASCVSKNNPEDESGAASIEFANPADSEIFINEGHTETVKIDLNLNNLTKQDLVIEAKSNPDNWCAAIFADKENAIVVTPGANETEEDLVAVFEVKATKEGVNPLTFTVTSVGSATEKYIRVTAEPELTEGEYGTITFNPSPAGATLVLKVETNLEKWYFGDSNMVFDDEYNPIEWYTVDKTSGRNGESLTITFSANSTTDDRRTSICLDETEGSSYSSYFSVMVTQGAKPATSVSLSVYDENYEPQPVSGKTYNVQFGKDDNQNCSLDFEIEKDGSVDFLFCKSGSTEKDPAIEGADNPWVMLSAMYGSYSLIPSANKTGKDRTTDLVIFSAGSSTELFRFTITQAGK